MSFRNRIKILKLISKFNDLVELAQSVLIKYSVFSRIVSEYRNSFKTARPQTHLDEFNEDIQTHFLELAKTMLVRLNSQYLAGFSFNATQDRIVGWFNNQPFHTSPLSINLIHNAMIKAKFDSNHSIRVTNLPIPFRVDSRMSMLMAGNNIGFQLATNISFAMAFVAAFYVMFYIKVSSSFFVLHQDKLLFETKLLFFSFPRSVSRKQNFYSLSVV